MSCGKLQSGLPDGYEQWLMPFFDKDLAECKLAKQLYGPFKYIKPSVMNQSTTVADATQQAVRPFEHIYKMKQAWISLLDKHKTLDRDNAWHNARRSITPFQIAYYAMRKNVEVRFAITKLMGTDGRGLYVQSEYLRNKLYLESVKIYNEYYKPQAVHYPAKQPE